MSSEFSGAEIFSRALPFDSTPTFSFASSPRGIKLKRSRQRVDAGQPRNSYSGQKGTPTSPAMSTTPFASSPSAHPFEAPISAPSPFTSLFHPSQMNAFYRLQQQALLSSTNLNDDSAKLTNNNTTATVALVEETPTVESNGNDTKTCDTCEDKEDEAEEVEEVAAKRSRVENIISNFHSAPSSPNVNADTSGSADVKSEGDEQRSVSAAGSETSPRSKRKQYQPQKETNGATQENGLEEDTEKEKAEEPVVDRVQHLLELQRRQYMEWIEAQQKARAGKEKEGEPEQNGAEDLRQHLKNIGGHKEIVGLSSALKSELLASITATVDRIMGDYIEKEQARFQAQMRAVEASRNQAAARASNPAYSLFNPYGAYGAALGAYGASFPHFPTSTASSNASIFPGSFASSPFPGSMHNNPFSAADSVARKDPFSLINMNKRKRSKVTDTRLGGRMGLKEEGSRGSPNGYYPPTMVGHPLYGSTLPGLGLDELRDNDSPSFSDDLSYESGPVDPNIPQSSTLTPMHLRKAKLMFFYTRYPSSTLIKTYFPDIRFNKNTTAQLVKWFSNFREFYYIQMEKFARQALAEGIRRPEDIHVSTDGDLYKTLNQHYNRNNHIQVPVEFRDVVEATLREFFLSLQAGKDVESSWKKQIYKVIARLDSSIPDYFKNPHFLDQLE